MTKLSAILEDVHERLAGVVIEQLPYAELIARYDREGTLFYLDPPYAGGEADYGPGIFGPEDFGRLAQQLGGIKGRFILSINDTPEIRKAFRGYALEEVETTYTVAAKGASRVRELLIGPPRGRARR